MCGGCQEEKPGQPFPPGRGRHWCGMVCMNRVRHGLTYGQNGESLFHPVPSDNHKNSSRQNIEVEPKTLVFEIVEILGRALL